MGKVRTLGCGDQSGPSQVPIGNYTRDHYPYTAQDVLHTGVKQGSLESSELKFLLFKTCKGCIFNIVVIF